MKAVAESTRIEILFNSVEIELTRRWAFHHVPTVFVHRSLMDLRMVVKAWWHLYHESSCAQRERNRTVWQRNPAYPALALETADLVSSLRQIHRLFALEALRSFRPLSQAERSSIGLLGLLTAYYVNPYGEKWTQFS